MSAHAGGGGAEAEWTEAHDERYEWVTRRYAATTLVAARARPPADRTAGAARDGAGRRTSAAGVEARQAEGHGDAVGDGGAVGRAARDRTARARPGAGRGLYRMDRSGRGGLRSRRTRSDVIGRYTGESLGVHSVCPFLSQTPDLALPPQSLPLTSCVNERGCVSANISAQLDTCGASLAAAPVQPPRRLHWHHQLTDCGSSAPFISRARSRPVRCPATTLQRRLCRWTGRHRRMPRRRPPPGMPSASVRTTAGPSGRPP